MIILMLVSESSLGERDACYPVVLALYIIASPCLSIRGSHRPLVKVGTFHAHIQAVQNSLLSIVSAKSTKVQRMKFTLQVQGTETDNDKNIYVSLADGAHSALSWAYQVDTSINVDSQAINLR